MICSFLSTLVCQHVSLQGLLIPCALLFVLICYLAARCLEFDWPPVVVSSDPVQISELLCKTIADAHARTCLYAMDHIQDMFRKPHDLSKVIFYKNMVSHHPKTSTKKTADCESVVRYLNYFLLLIYHFVVGPRGALVRVCPETHHSDSTNYWIRQDGAWLHEAVTGRSDCPSESR